MIVGDDGRVRVLDFGLARAADQQETYGDNLSETEPAPETADERPKEYNDSFDWKEISTDSSHNLLLSPLTHAGGILGTPLYMAPEQHLGLKADERTDQFGFCVVLYEALYGKRPYSARSMEDLKTEVIRQRVRVPRTDSEVPVWIWQIIRRGLSADPEERYETIGSLLEDLDSDPEEERRLRRARRQRKLFLIGVVVLAIVLPISIWYGLRYVTVLQCKEEIEAETAGVWGDPERSKLEKAFLATKASYAPSTWTRVQDALDSYINDLSTKWTAMCDSAWTGVQSEDFFLLKMRCLRRRLVEFRKLHSIFTHASEKVVLKAVQAASGLSSLSHCLDEEALASRLELPHERIAPKVEFHREELLTVKMLENSGRYEDGWQLARKVLSQALELDYDPLLAEAFHLVGRLERRIGKYKEAKANLKKAYWKALAAAHYEIMAHSSISLVWTVGYHQSRFDEGLFWIQTAGSAIEQLKNPQDLMYRLHSTLGTLHSLNGDYDRALEQQRLALEIVKTPPGPEDAIDKGNILSNIGNTFGRKGQFDEALQYYQNALDIGEKVLGEKHPEIARRLMNMGLLYWLKKEYDRSMEYHQRSLIIWEAALGKEHPMIVWSLYGLGKGYQQRGDHPKAHALFERIAAICEKKTCAPKPEGMAYFGMAQLLAADDRKKSRQLAGKAITIIAKIPRLKKNLDEINEWMQEQKKL